MIFAAWQQGAVSGCQSGNKSLAADAIVSRPARMQKQEAIQGCSIGDDFNP